jgi:hypothetical protein
MYCSDMSKTHHSNENHSTSWRARTLADELHNVSSILASASDPECIEGQGLLEEFALPASTLVSPEAEYQAPRIPSELALAMRWGIAEDGITPLRKGGHASANHKCLVQVCTGLYKPHKPIAKSPLYRLVQTLEFSLTKEMLLTIVTTTLNHVM